MCNTLLVGAVLQPEGSGSALALSRHCSFLQPLLVSSAGPCGPWPVHCHRSSGLFFYWQAAGSSVLGRHLSPTVTRISPCPIPVRRSRFYSLVSGEPHSEAIECPHHLVSRPLSRRASPSLSAKLTQPRAWSAAGLHQSRLQRRHPPSTYTSPFPKLPPSASFPGSSPKPSHPDGGRLRQRPPPPFASPHPRRLAFNNV